MDAGTAGRNELETVSRNEGQTPRADDRRNFAAALNAHHDPMIEECWNPPSCSGFRRWTQAIHLSLGATIMRAGSIALLSALLLTLCGAGYYAYLGMTVPGDPVPDNIYVALALGVGCSLIVGIGLMVLMFYSSRDGYDEQPNYRNER
jgi:hypothetical protein